jgi:hypothetical protein
VRAPSESTGTHTFALITTPCVELLEQFAHATYRTGLNAISQQPRPSRPRHQAECEYC